MTLASYISIIRIILIIPIISLSYQNNSLSNFLAFSIFIFAIITDYLDGYIARKTNTVTPLGALLDLLADKLLVCLILIWLVFLIPNFYVALPVLIIVSRELMISSIRQFLAESRTKNNLKVSFIGKSKTTLQFLSISTFLIYPEINSKFFILAIFSLWASALLTLISFIHYVMSWRTDQKNR